MTTVVSNTVWLEGHAANEAGQPSTANPYPAGSQNSADWITGYAAAEEAQILASQEALETGDIQGGKELDEKGVRAC